MQTGLLLKLNRVLFILILTVVVLYYGSEFLIPIAFAGILAFLFLPLSCWLESKGVPKIFAIILCILLLICVFAGIIALLTWQLTDLVGSFNSLEQMINKMTAQLQNMIDKTFGINPKEQQQILQQQQQQSGSGSMGKMASGAVGTIMGIAVDVVLTLVYIFLFLYFRTHIRLFILKIVPVNQREKTTTVMHDSGKVAQQYIVGLSAMIVCLWIMYGIGFSLVGVKSAIFFAVLCGLLEIVPFVGNLVGTTLTVLMSVAQGDSHLIFGIILVYAMVQFIQTYILEPLVVGSEVNINPLFTIMVIVAGELVWGIPGMILAIPILGILKIIFDHVEPLKPYGFLIGESKKKKTGLVDKIKAKFNKK